mmetsp:Transcript_33297/g.72994  ORF Transcript_33297/g.72994 Transcript_33297/m.72994 type:complete len:87 (+) Transcript_33297:3-263(+)
MNGDIDDDVHVHVGGEGSSDSIAIMKDIEENLKITRRLQELYNFKTCGYGSPGLGSCRPSVEALGNGPSAGNRRTGLQRRFSAKGA